MEWHHNPKLVANSRALRKNMTKEERKLWYQFLRGHELRFRRQEIIDTYIVDFYCDSAKLAIELDGSQHYESSGLLRDVIRTRKIKQFGIEVIRIPNNAVTENFTGVCEYLDEVLRRRGAELGLPTTESVK